MATARHKPGAKLCELDREKAFALVAKLHRRGWLQWDIAAELGKEFNTYFSQATVSQYISKIRANYKQVQIQERREQVNEKLEQYREIRREAWVAYDRSQLDANKEVEEFGQVSEDVGYGDRITSEERIKRIVTKEGRLPANQYLGTIMETLKAERDLLGLDEEVNARVVAVDDAMNIIRSVLEAQRDVLGGHPELLQAVQRRVVALIPAEMLNNMRQPLRIVDARGQVDVGGP